MSSRHSRNSDAGPSRTRHAHRLIARALAVCGGAMAVTLVAATAAPAGSLPPLHVAFVDVPSDSLRVGDVDGSNATTLTPASLKVGSYSVSTNSDLAAVTVSTDTWNKYWVGDAAGALLISQNGVTKVVASQWEGTPLVLGSSVYFLADGDLMQWTGFNNALLALTNDGRFAYGEGPESDMQVVNLQRDTQGNMAFVWASFDKKGAIDDTVIQWISSYGLTMYTSPVYHAPGPLIAIYDRPMIYTAAQGATPDDAGLYFQLCSDTSCTSRTLQHVKHDLTLNVVPDVVDTYALQSAVLDANSSATTWFEFKDTGTGSSMVTSMANVGKPSDVASTWMPRIDGSTTADYQVTTGTLSPITIPGQMRSMATIEFSSERVAVGKSVVYLAVCYYGRDDASSSMFDIGWVMNGTLQTSLDGKHYTSYGKTSGATKIPVTDYFETYYGNGRTAALKQNTWVRWVYSGSVLVKPSTTHPVEILVYPVVTTKIVTSGAYKTISGHATRVGGKVTLVKGGKTLAATSINSKGNFTFKKMKLAHGDYYVVVAKDAKWTSVSKRIHL